jgi:hypothetical protein
MVWDPIGWYLKDHADEFDVALHKPTDLVAYVTEHFKGDFRILYTPLGGNMMHHWREFATVAYAAGNVFVCIDEIGMLCDGGKFKPDAKGKDPILELMVHYGRHRKLTIMATSQCPPDVAKRYRAMCTEMRLFRTIEPDHLDYFAERVGKETAAKLPKLPKYAFVWWKDDGENLIVAPQKGG